MRKLYLLVTMLMAMCLSNQSAWAVLVPGDNTISEVSDGNTFFVRGDWTNGTTGSYLETNRWFGVQYPKVTDDYQLTVVTSASSMGETYAFTVEDAFSTIGGVEAFYLKNVSTGLYLAKNKTEGNYKESAIDLVATKEEASLWGFKKVNLMYDTAPEEAMQIFTLANDGSTLLYFNNNYNGSNGVYTPRVATWTDGTTWHNLIEATEGSEEDALIDAMMYLYAQLESYYPAVGGTEPGYYSAEVANEFNAAYVECNIDDILDSEDYSIDKLRAAKERLEAIAIEILKGPQTLKDGGYYYVISSNTWTVNVDDERAIYDNNSQAYWATIDRTNPDYIWQFHKTEDGYFLMQNFQTGQYIITVTNNGTCTLGADDTQEMHVNSLGGGQFNLTLGTSTNNSMHCKSHNDGAGTAGSITGYPGGKDSPSSWRFETVAESVIDSLSGGAQKQQEAIAVHDSLTTLISKVSQDTKAAFEYEIPEDAKDVTPLSGDDFDSNAAMSAEHGYSWGNDGQGYAALIDGDLTTYFHTCWTGANITSSSYDADGNPTGYYTTLHNLGMKLAAPVSNVTFQVSARKSVYNNPTKIDVEVSEDGENWSKIYYGYDFFTPTTDPNDPYLMGPFELGGTYQYVRFSNYKNDREGKKFFCFSELKVYEGARLTSTCQASTMDASVVSGLLNAYSDANKYVDVFTTDDLDAMNQAVNNLNAAYNNFLGNFADPTTLNNAIADGKDMISNIITGEGQVGLYPEGTSTVELENAIEAGETLLSNGYYTQEGVDAAASTINEAIAAIEVTAIQPDPTKWYQFQFANAEEYEALNYSEGDALIDHVATVAQTWSSDLQQVVYYDDIATLRMNGSLFAAPIAEVPNPDLYAFRFIPIEGGYAIQNKATGLYINELPYSAKATVTDKPGLFKVVVLGAGFCVIESYNLYTGEGREGGVNTLHFSKPEQYCEMRGWPDHKLGTKSATKIIETGETVDADAIGTAYRNLDEGKAYVATYNANISDISGTEAYTVMGEFEEDGIYYIGMKLADEVKAGEPVVLIGGADPAAFHFGSEITAEPLTENGLVGVLQATDAEDVAALLNNTDEGAQWKNVSGVQSIAAGAGYLNGSVKAITAQEYEAAENHMRILLTKTITGIKSALADNGTNSKAVYNLNGQRVANTSNLNGLRAGIYVINGKKVLIP